MEITIQTRNPHKDVWQYETKDYYAVIHINERENWQGFIYGHEDNINPMQKTDPYKYEDFKLLEFAVKHALVNMQFFKEIL